MDSVRTKCRGWCGDEARHEHVGVEGDCFALSIECVTLFLIGVVHFDRGMQILEARLRQQMEFQRVLSKQLEVCGLSITKNHLCILFYFYIWLLHIMLSIYNCIYLILIFLESEEVAAADWRTSEAASGYDSIPIEKHQRVLVISLSDSVVFVYFHE